MKIESELCHGCFRMVHGNLHWREAGGTVLLCFLFIFQLVSCAAPVNNMNPMGSMAADLERVVVAICHTAPKLENIIGTAFIVSQNGLLITADHVITDDKGNVLPIIYGLRPNYPQIEPLKLSVVKRFREGISGRDIAVLRIESADIQKNLPFLPLGESVESGEEVLISGFPLVFDKVYIWPLVRRGVVSSIRYTYEESQVLILDMGAINGFSGSPIISLKTRKVIGVMRGESNKIHHTNFSVASKLTAADLIGIEK